jgi:CubicO group peptidase (beta-lactamase class C family)
MKLRFCYVGLLLVRAIIFADSANGQSTADHIHAVETSLSSAEAISGHPQPPMNVAERMAYYRVPGASVAVIHRGKIEWARGYGVLDIGGPSVTAETLFSAASISKTLIAMAVLSLVQQGKIDLDANVNSYLNKWKIPENEFTVQRPVTTRELLNHTSGISESLGSIYKPSEMPTLAQMLNGEPPARNAAVRVKMVPGTKFEYANDGYLVLQALIIDVTGKSFAEAMHDMVLLPLNMSHSTFETPLSLSDAKHAASAFGGMQTKGTPPEQLALPNQAAGSLWTTPTDLAKVILEIEDAYAGRHSRLLTQKTARMMLTPGPGFPTLAQGSVFAGAEHWGLGIELGGKPRHPFLDHGGSAVYNSFMFSYLDGEGIVVMTNSTTGSHIYQEFLASAASVYGWPDFRTAEHKIFPIESKDLEKFVGKYDFIRITKSDDILQAEVLGEGKQMQMYAFFPTHFFVLDTASEFDFTASETGEITTLRLVTPTFSVTLPRSR